MASEERNKNKEMAYHHNSSFPETSSLRRTRREKLLFSLLIFIAFSFYFSSTLSATDLRFLPANLSVRSNPGNLISNVMKAEFQEVTRLSRHVNVSSVKYESVSVLLPDWEVLVILSPETLAASDSVEDFYCLFSTNQTSPARFSGVLPFTERTAFKCIMPNGSARRHPFWQPILTKNPEKETPAKERELLRMKKLAYESISTEDDVVLFVKGVNGRSRFKPPQDFMCVFGDDEKTAVKTPVTSSTQEVFRCSHPDLTAFASVSNHPPVKIKIKISLRITNQNRTLPSVAYYAPKRKLASPPEPKSEICACSMIYNVAKFLKEWVIYHSKIGVEKFILYDNGSDDDLQNVVSELNGDGYNVTTLLWIWPKTQEAGFSHNAINAKDSCKWMLYVDVDEFVYSPSWNQSSNPSKHMLKTLIPPELASIGQVSIKCLDFGPSGQKSHPVEGVTQGYNCQRWDVSQQRHKSMVLLEAIDDSLGNVVHHFGLKKKKKKKFEFEWRRIDNAVVNHYKYQAWSEFKTKFRRRVSAYVVDWREETNPNSKDRAPGLGFEPVEPQGWENKFCDFKDDALKLLTRRWFGEETPNGYKMAWQQR